MFVKVISLLFLVRFIFAEDSLLRACPVEDIQCLSETTANFLEQTASGIENFNIKAIDPIVIDMVCTKPMDGVMFHLRNVNVTGLKKQDISDFKMDTVAKSVLLSLKVNVNIASDIEVEYEETKKSYTGTYHAKGKATVTARYNYEVTADDKGVEHFMVGPETLTCEFNDFESGVNQELTEKIMNDPHARKLYDENLSKLTAIRKENACNVVKAAYASVMHNLRAAARAYPKSAFFTNV